MSVNLVVTGNTYVFPQIGEENWGSEVTGWATAVTSGMLQKSGGTFTLTAEVDFGTLFGLKSLYYKSRGTNPSATGVLRLANTETISSRNAANSADFSWGLNASNAWSSTAPIGLTDGSAANPGYSFTSDLTSGMYLVTAAAVGISAGGTNALTISATLFNTNNAMAISTGVGSASSPSYQFNNDSNTGIYRSASDELSVSTNGVQRIAFGNTNLTSFFYGFFQDGTNLTGSLKLGADDNARTLTDATAKRGLLVSPHYTNAEEPFVWMNGYSSVSNNQLEIGGSTSNTLNSATVLTFLVAANNTTVTPTEIGRCSVSGVRWLGTNTNDDAAAGYYGEAIRSFQTFTSGGATTVWANLTSLALTKGDWDLDALVAHDGNGFTATGNAMLAISIFSGNTTTDHVIGDNVSGIVTSNIALIYRPGNINGYRLKLAADTTVYLKVMSTFSAGSPLYAGRISARRMR